MTMNGTPQTRRRYESVSLYLLGLSGATEFKVFHIVVVFPGGSMPPPLADFRTQN